MSAAIDRVGVMVVRVWVEQPSRCLRARLSCTLDVSDRDQTTQVASTSEEILAIVADWLDAFAADHGAASNREEES